MKSKVAFLGMLVVLSFLVPYLEPLGNAAPPDGGGSASGRGMIYPVKDDSQIGAYFDFRLRMHSAADPVHGSFDFKLLNGSQLKLALENVQVENLTIEQVFGGFQATFNGTAMVNDYSTTSTPTLMPVSFNATAVDGATDDFSVTIATSSYSNIGFDGTLHFSITIKAR